MSQPVFLGSETRLFLVDSAPRILSALGAMFPAIKDYKPIKAQISLLTCRASHVCLTDFSCSVISP